MFAELGRYVHDQYGLPLDPEPRLVETQAAEQLVRRLSKRVSELIGSRELPRCETCPEAHWHQRTSENDGFWLTCRVDGKFYSTSPHRGPCPHGNLLVVLTQVRERLADLEWAVHDSRKMLESGNDRAVERAVGYLKEVDRTEEQISKEILSIPSLPVKAPKTMNDQLHWGERRQMTVGGSSLCHRCHRVHPAGPCENFAGIPELLGPWVDDRGSRTLQAKGSYCNSCHRIHPTGAPCKDYSSQPEVSIHDLPDMGVGKLLKGQNGDCHYWRSDRGACSIGQRQPWCPVMDTCPDTDQRCPDCHRERDKPGTIRVAAEDGVVGGSTIPVRCDNSFHNPPPESG
jgi:hypothetical protein